MKKLIKTLVIGTLISSIFVGCSSSESTNSNEQTESAQTNAGGKVVVVGSTTVQPVAQEAADAFMELNPDIKIEVQGVGSSAGIKAAIDGTADIGASSRELKEEEKESNLNEHIIAHDAIAVAINPNNPVENLSLEEVRKIFTGDITNWSEVGGNEADIIVISREDGSGTRSSFQEIVGFEEPTAYAVIKDGNGAVKSDLSSQENGIGYISLGIVDETVKSVSIDGVLPTLDTTKSGEYPVARNLLMLTNDEISSEANSYLDFILSDEGQEIVAEHYIPIN